MTERADDSLPVGLDPTLADVGAHVERNHVRASAPSAVAVAHVMAAVPQWASRSGYDILRSRDRHWIVQSNTSAQTFEVVVEGATPPVLSVLELHPGHDEVPVTASAILVKIDRCALAIAVAAGPPGLETVHADYRLWVQPRPASPPHLEPQPRPDGPPSTGPEIG